MIFKTSFVYKIPYFYFFINSYCIRVYRLWQGFLGQADSLQGDPAFLFVTQADFDPLLFSRVRHAVYP